MGKPAYGKLRRPFRPRKGNLHSNSGSHTRGQKRKAKAQQPDVKAARTSGDDLLDDFAGVTQELEDYRPVDDGADTVGGSDSGLEPTAAERGNEGSLGSQQAADDGDAAASRPTARQQGGGPPAKKRRKRGPKLSALEFEARREMVQRIAECSAEEQADWLWGSYQQHAAASALERGGLTAVGIAPLQPEGSFEERLRALQPDTWQQEFCNRGGAPCQQGKGAQRREQGGKEGRAPGSPSLLLVSPSALGAVGLIKLVPSFNKACRIAKLFAKHFKVAEQEELLRTQVVCVAAGTPNRLCKLADSGALRLDRLKHVVLDVQLDAKQRDILAIPETVADWWTFFERHLKDRLAAGSLKLSLVNSDHAAQHREQQ